MPQILSNVQGDVAKNRSVPIAANQSFTFGDIVTLTDGLATKGAIGATTIFGFAVHPATTGAQPTAADRLIIYQAHGLAEFKADLKDGVAATDALRGTDAGFIVENGYLKLDPDAAVKQVTIIDVVEPFGNQVVFAVKAANRVI